jgi:hypothetical protein
MDFIIGGFTAVIAISGYWAMLAIYDWIDTRRACRIRRDAARQSQP